MQVYRSVGDVPEGFGPSAVTIGKFDGMHIGHRAVISRLRGLAQAGGLLATVMTFEQNPLALVDPEKCPPAIASSAQKLQSLAAAGVDATLMVAFDRAFSTITPLDFMQSILMDALHARVLLVGSDFRFGHGREGTVDTLREFGSPRGIEVLVIDDVIQDDLPHGDRGRVSSTLVRALIADGRVADAALLLGAPHSVRGVVVRGARRGRALGYPTANLSPQLEGLVPADGVYAAWLTIEGIRYPSAVSVGNNPTFEGVPQKQVEAHALDVDLDFYDRVAEVSFVEFVRGMERFDSVEMLVGQMRDDERRVRSILGIAAKR